MDIEEIWDTFKQKNILIPLEFEEYINIVKKKNGNLNLTSNIIGFLKENLYTNPYPTWQLVEWLIKTQNNEIFEKIAYAAFQVLTDMLNNTETLYRNRFYNLYANINVSEKYLKKINNELIPIIIKKKKENLLCPILYLVLLARDNIDVLKKIFNVCYTCESDICKPKNIFVNAIVNKKNTFSDMVSQQNLFMNPEHATISDIEQYILFTKLLIAYNNMTKLSIAAAIEKVNLILSIIKFPIYNHYCEAYFLEIKRQVQIFNYFMNKKINVSYDNIYEYISKHSILNILFFYDNLSVTNYRAIKYMLEQDYDFNIKIHESYTKNEIFLYEQYIVIKLTLEIICIKNNNNHCEDAFIDSNLSRIAGILRNLYDITLYTETIRIMFSFIFLRNDHIEKHINEFDESKNWSGNSKSDESKVETKNIENYQYNYHGFLCTNVVLKKLLEFLKYNIIRKIKSIESQRNIDDSILEILKELLKNIEDGLWRYNLFSQNSQQIYSEHQVFDQINFKSVLKLQPNKNALNESSEEDNYSENIPNIRKKRKRVFDPESCEFTNPSTSLSTTVSTTTSATTESDGLRNVKSPLFYKDIKELKTGSIIFKMFGTADNLAANFMTRGDKKQIKKVIQFYDLKDSTIATEVEFLETFEATKVKIIEIYQIYQKYEMETKQDYSTMEYIKRAAAVGFEASNITNIIEEFAIKNKIKLPNETTELLDKYSEKYNFLNYYKTDYIDITTVIDLMLSTANNYDIILNVYKIIKNHWNLDYANVEKSKDNQSYYYFFKNLIDVLYNYNHTNHLNMNIKTIFNHEIFPLTNECINNLDKEKLFQRIYSMRIKQNKINNIENLEMISNQFEIIKCDNNYLNKLLSYMKNMNTLYDCGKKYEIIEDKDIISYDNNEIDILLLNSTSILGKLSFLNNINLNDIEIMANNLNINLVHALVLNICNEINTEYREYSENENMLKALTNYINIYDCTEEKNLISSLQRLQKPKKKIISEYIKKTNYLLYTIVANVLHLIDTDNLINDYINNIKKIYSTKVLSHLYNNNLILSALNKCNTDIKKVCTFLSKHDLKANIKLLNALTELEYKKYKKILDDIFDKIIYYYLLSLETIDDDIVLLEKINNITLRVKCLKKVLIKFVSPGIIINEIKKILLDSDAPLLDIEEKNNLYNLMKNIQIYQQISKTIMNFIWLDVMKECDKTPTTIFNHLCSLKLYELCQKWLNLNCDIKFNLDFITIFENLQLCLYCEDKKDNINPMLFELIELLPAEHVVQLYQKSLLQLNNSYIIEHIIQYLSKISDSPLYQKYRISLKILEYQTKEEKNELNDLISRPFLIIEQLLMNSKFDLLTLIINHIRGLLHTSKCIICYGNRCCIYDIKNNSDPEFNRPKNFIQIDGKNIMYLDYNASHSNEYLTHDCLDFLLRAYSAKALDFRIIEQTNESLNLQTSISDLASIDSLCELFIMPNEIPSKENWIKDSDAKYCMCCKRSLFSMFTRRHHCRRCGRVVCHLCSTQWMKIPTIYSNVLVRACNDCYTQTNLNSTTNVNTSHLKADICTQKEASHTIWNLSLSDRHNLVTREEFCYEYAPSVSLCLSIISLHSAHSKECSNFLMHYCKKFQKILLTAQQGFICSEIDYVLVARILHCLALAAKFHSGSSECNMMIDNADIICSVVKNGYEGLLPKETINSFTLRKLCDSLVEGEIWSLALDLSVKCGFSSNGVMTAWGISCLKVGSLNNARSKFKHCMNKLMDEHLVTNTIKSLEIKKIENTLCTNRPTKSAPLLNEIISILKLSSLCLPLETNDGNKKPLISNEKSGKNVEYCPLQEPAQNILNSLNNISDICKGNYEDSITNNSIKISNKCNKNKLVSVIELDSYLLYYRECLYYLFMYGSHIDIIEFLIEQKQIGSALKYIKEQKLDPQIFITYIYMPHLKQGEIELIIDSMMEFDETLVTWKLYIMRTCSYLEKKGLLNSLYQLQLLLRDPIRASMTCIKFYSINCYSFNELLSNNFHLLNAQKHLQKELELSQWEEIVVDNENNDELSLLMKLDSKTLNDYINIIWKQIEVSKFLANCEKNGVDTIRLLKKIGMEINNIPILFGSKSHRIQLAILILICGKNIEEGYGLAFRLIDELDLNPLSVYGITAKFLIKNNRLQEIEKLIDCIQSNVGYDKILCDEIILLATQFSVNSQFIDNRTSLENIICRITNIDTKIKCHLLNNQIKSAYLLAVQNNNCNQLQQVLKHSSNHYNIRKLCEKKIKSLQNNK